MKPVRKRFEGVINLVRFNWHYYLILFLALILIFFAGLFVVKYRIFATIFIVATLLFCIFSIVATYYIYDRSPLYKFTWFKDQLYHRPARIVNIHGGYDETSKLIAELYPKDEVSVFDFYNPEKNAEISTKRARKTNPPFAGTRNITIDHIPLKDGYADRIFLILSTHEIRSNKERNIFFEELNRVLSRNGKIIEVIVFSIPRLRIKLSNTFSKASISRSAIYLIKSLIIFSWLAWACVKERIFSFISSSLILSICEILYPYLFSNEIFNIVFNSLLL